MFATGQGFISDLLIKPKTQEVFMTTTTDLTKFGYRERKMADKQGNLLAKEVEEAMDAVSEYSAIERTSLHFTPGWQFRPTHNFVRKKAFLPVYLGKD